MRRIIALFLLTIVISKPNAEGAFVLSAKTEQRSNITIVNIFVQAPVKAQIQAYDVYFTHDNNLVAVITDGKVMKGEYDHIQLIGNAKAYKNLGKGEKVKIATLIYKGGVQVELSEKSNIAIANSPKSPKVIIQN